MYGYPLYIHMGTPIYRDILIYKGIPTYYIGVSINI